MEKYHKNPRKISSLEKEQLAGARAYMQRWADYQAANPDADETAVARAMKAGELPPSSSGNLVDSLAAVTKLPAFDNSPLAQAYYTALHAIAADDPKNEGKQKISVLMKHKRIAMWVAWAAHKGAGGLVEMVGLPKTQAEFADLIGVGTRTIWNYQQKYADYVDVLRTSTIKKLLGDYRIDAVKALGRVATNETHPQFSQSQRTFFTMAGDLIQRTDVTSDGESVAVPIAYIAENRNDNPND